MAGWGYPWTPEKFKLFNSLGPLWAIEIITLALPEKSSGSEKNLTYMYM